MLLAVECHGHHVPLVAFERGFYAGKPFSHRLLFVALDALPVLRHGIERKAQKCYADAYADDAASDICGKAHEKCEYTFD